MHPKMKALAVTLALATVVTAAACGDDDVPDAATALESAAEESAADAMVPAPADVAGSDQHHFNRAAELARQERVNAAATARLTGEAERQAKLEGLARTYGDEHRQPNTDAAPNAFEAGNRAAAEELERQAHLDGQDQTYGGGR
jgi:hypothetical protein